MAKFSLRTKTLKRSGVMLLALFLALILLLLRIFAIQIFDFERYQKKVLDQMTTESPVRASRGQILDASGRVLASNKTVYRVSIFPNVIANSEDNESLGELIASGLCEAIEGLDIDTVKGHISHTNALERTVVKSLEPEQVEGVLTFIKDNKLYDMIRVDAVSERYYPYGSLASHVLGFTGSDGQGLYGLELQYDELLRGTDGSYVTARDSMGNEMPNAYEAYIPAVDGATVHTTLDAYVQAVLEEQLETAMIESGAANRACGIVMDVNSGAILAMATGPSFDLNNPFELNESAKTKLALMGYAEDSDAYVSAKNQLLLETWSNKSVTEIYMPGSTFKTLTCSAVLEEGAVKDLNELFYCTGALQVADRIIHCHKKGGHGSLSFCEGLQNSCNPVMMTIAARIGTEAFYEYVRAFGLLERTGIDLPGEGNSIFHAPSKFTELDLATASFGQNFKISAIQLICAVAAVANGGELLTPYLVERIENADNEVIYTHERTVRRQVIREETARTVSKILAEGVAGDGGAKNAYVAGYRVAAKTGTSEKIGDDASARISSCVAFAPADAPEVAVIIVVDEPTEGSKYGSVVAAPYVANVLEAILPYLGVEPIYTEEELKNLSLRVPECTGWTPEQAIQMLSQAGFSYKLVGEGEYITSQMPLPNTSVLREGAVVVLTLGEEKKSLLSVPLLVGKSAAQANQLLINMGFNIQIQGGRDYLATNKLVVAQSVAAGELVPLGTVIVLRFPYDESPE